MQSRTGDLYTAVPLALGMLSVLSTQAFLLSIALASGL